MTNLKSRAWEEFVLWLDTNTEPVRLPAVGNFPSNVEKISDILQDCTMQEMFEQYVLWEAK